MKQTYLSEILAAQKRGKARGITSICSAHPYVIEATLRHALVGETPVLIEATCNQVNQFGGYTGMTPQDYVSFVGRIAGEVGFPLDRAIFGGDHLGPNPWQAESAAAAMEKAGTLVQAFVGAGFTKIHLDASMKCADDDAARPLATVVAAQRAADLARVAEAAYRSRPTGMPPRYVIGTEVPIPGGAQEHEEGLTVTRPEDVAETIEVTRAAFGERGLEAAWPRVIAVVVQPGVEFGDSNLFEYRSDQVQTLSRFIEAYDGLVYEAHSTDYQTREALRALVTDHFAILKVGPALTFALREAIFALAQMEDEWLAGRPEFALSHVREILDNAMLANPAYWQKYYGGNSVAQRFARKYSFSDRARYYWPVPTVQAALDRLLANLSAAPVPLTLLSQVMPVQYEQVRQGKLENHPRALILGKIAAVLDDYAYACQGMMPGT